MRCLAQGAVGHTLQAREPGAGGNGNLPPL